MAQVDMNDPSVKLAVHEAVCAERYANLMARMSRLEKIAISVAGVLLVGMAGVIWTQIKIGG